MVEESKEARTARAERDRKRNEAKRAAERERRQAEGLPAKKTRVRKPRPTFADHIEVLNVRNGKHKVNGTYFFDLLVGGVFLTKWFKFELFSGSVQPPSRNRWRPTTIVNGYGDNMQKIVLVAIEKAIGEEIGEPFRFPDRFQFPRQGRLLPPSELDEEDEQEEESAPEGVVETVEHVADVAVAVIQTPEEVCREILAANPGITQLAFENLAMGKGVKRASARSWHEDNIRNGAIRTEQFGDGATQLFQVA